MRVAIATWKFPDPTEPYVVNEVVGLIDRGIDCVVIAEEIDAGADHPALRAVRGRLEMIESSSQVVRRGHTPPLLAARADVIHFEQAGIAVRYRHLLPRLRGAKVVSCRGTEVRIEVLGPAWIDDRFSRVFDLVDRIHCVSAELGDRCVELGARPEQLHIATSGADLRVFTPRPSPPRPEGLALRIVSVGRLDWVKGYEYAVHAVRLVRDAGHRVTYTIVGIDEGAESAIRLAIHDFGLGDVVTLAGHLPPEGVRDALAGSDIFLMASVTEGTPSAAMEAMAMGLPVVITDVGGTREVVTDGVDGFVVPSRDPAALAAAVEKLLPADTRRQMGRRAAEEARHRLGFDTHLDGLVEVFRELITPPQVAPHAAIANDDDLVSVVIAARNAEATIEDQLRALSFQRYEGDWEVVVVDNGSTDDTRARALGWVDRLPGLRVVDASDRGNIAYARNVGVRRARGRRILMCDADDVVAPGWLAALAGGLDHHPLVVGALERSMLVPARVDRGAGVDTAPPSFGDDHRARVLTGNVGFHREVFDRVGGFDESLRRGEDLDFGWRAIEAGFDPQFVAEAIVHYRSEWRAAGVARKGFADGQTWPALYLRHRGTGMDRPSTAVVVARYRELVRGPASRSWSGDGRIGWVYGVAHSAGRIVGSLRHRVMFL